MGLLDDMAAAMKAENERPDGWVTVKEFAEAAGVSRSNVERLFAKQVKTGNLICRHTIGTNGKRVTIFGEPLPANKKPAVRPKR